MTWIIIAAGIVALAAWAVSIYNGLIKRRNMAEEGWSGIDVQLKRRADLIPNLVESVKGYATHERGLLERVTELRNQARAAPAGDVAARSQIEGMLSGALGRLLAVVENYPELKANENFLALQESLQSIENDIQMARRYYNGAVRELNVLVESVPSNLLAKAFGFRCAAYFALDDARDGLSPQLEF